MATETLNYVEKMEAAVLNNLVSTETSDIYEIATDMAAQDQAAFEHIWEAYEIVKHNILG